MKSFVKSFAALAFGMMAIAMASCNKSNDSTSNEPRSTFTGDYNASAVVTGKITGIAFPTAPGNTSIPATITGFKVTVTASGDNDLAISATITLPAYGTIPARPINIANLVISKEVMNTDATPQVFYGHISQQSISITAPDSLGLSNIPLVGTGKITAPDNSKHDAVFTNNNGTKTLTIGLKSADSWTVGTLVISLATNQPTN